MSKATRADWVRRLHRQMENTKVARELSARWRDRLRECRAAERLTRAALARLK